MREEAPVKYIFLGGDKVPTYLGPITSLPFGLNTVDDIDPALYP